MVDNMRNYDYIIITSGVYYDMIGYDKDLMCEVVDLLCAHGGKFLVVGDETLNNKFISNNLWFTPGMNGNLVVSNSKGTYQFNDIIACCDITSYWNFVSNLYLPNCLACIIDLFKYMMRSSKNRIETILRIKGVYRGNVENIIFRIDDEYLFDEQALETKMNEIINNNNN